MSDANNTSLPNGRLDVSALPNNQTGLGSVVSAVSMENVRRQGNRRQL